MDSCFAPGFKLEPYWWDATPRPVLEDQACRGSADVVVVGSGYTGLHAALELARAGRSVLFLMLSDAGFGCSSRNGGQISTSIKPGLDELTRGTVRRQGGQSCEPGMTHCNGLASLSAREKIDCDFIVPGRFHAAHNQRQFDKLVRTVENQPRALRCRPLLCRAISSAMSWEQTHISVAWCSRHTHRSSRRAIIRGF
jgi:glycine/D-amino acid oxidase-like deaminating enzyme